MLLFVECTLCLSWYSVVCLFFTDSTTCVTFNWCTDPSVSDAHRQYFLYLAQLILFFRAHQFYSRFFTPLILYFAGCIMLSSVHSRNSVQSHTKHTTIAQQFRESVLYCLWLFLRYFALLLFFRFFLSFGRLCVFVVVVTCAVVRYAPSLKCSVCRYLRKTHDRYEKIK